MVARTQFTNASVAEVARRVCVARLQGLRRIAIGKVEFDLRQTGRCAQFVRECHEAALGLAEYSWQYRASSAAMMERKLRAAGLAVEAPEPGDVVGINGDVPEERWDDWGWQQRTGRYGHIGIYLGGGELAENTSSRVRGPGHVISKLTALKRRITGYYRTLPSAKSEVSLRVWLLPQARRIDCAARLEQGTARADLRPLVEALGRRVEYRGGEVFIRERSSRRDEREADGHGAISDTG